MKICRLPSAAPGFSDESTIHVNSGIVMIVPVEQVKPLLDNPEFKRQRDKAVLQLNTKTLRVNSNKNRTPCCVRFCARSQIC
jgi:hypothetical protein